MRFVSIKRIVVVSILAAACGLLLTNLLASSVSTPRRGALVGAATVSPFAMMMKASPNLPVEQYDSY